MKQIEEETKLERDIHLISLHNLFLIWLNDISSSLLSIQKHLLISLLVIHEGIVDSELLSFRFLLVESFLSESFGLEPDIFGMNL